MAGEDMPYISHGITKETSEHAGRFETKENSKSQNKNIFDRGLTTRRMDYHFPMIAKHQITVKLLDFA
jgi:hypothetical protein